ncbi:MAG: hybrid sensor histidine kinase/response regulator [Spirochaetota bacterium]
MKELESLRSQIDTLKSHQEQLKNMYSSFQQLFSEMPNGFCHLEMVTENDGRPCDCIFLNVNPAFEMLTGLHKDDITGKSAKEFLSSITPSWARVCRDTAIKGKTVNLTSYVKHLDKHLDISAFSPRKGEFIAIFTDITRVKKIEDEKKRLELQLIQSQKLEAIGTLAGGVAHDFNNLLTAINGYAELACSQLEDPQYINNCLRQILNITQRASQLSHQLIIFGRKEPMKLKPHNLSHIIEYLFNMLKRIIGEHVTISFELDPHLWTTRVDSGQIEQVILNLAINAKDAMKDGGTLTIRTKNVKLDDTYADKYTYASPGNYVCLALEDTGIGMDKDTLDHIFEPFFTTKKSGEGSGLGLSVVYGIIKEHNGWINVYSEPGIGTIFRIYLPAFSGKHKPVDRTGKKLKLEKFQGNGEKILYVEDDKNIRESTQKQLTENGYKVYACSNAREALNVYAVGKRNIDLLFADMVLPDRGGVELANILVSSTSNLKVLLTSGYLDKKVEWPVIKEKNYHFIQKPYTTGLLLQCIKKSLNGTE